MNNYKKEVKDRLTEKEDIDIVTINKIMKEPGEKHLKVKIKITKEKVEWERWERTRGNRSERENRKVLETNIPDTSE